MRNTLFHALVVSSVLHCAAAVQANPTIDKMYTYDWSHFAYSAQNYGLVFVGSARAYLLSDGSSWYSGGGYAPLYRGHLAEQVVNGNTISYALDVPVGSLVYRQTDYDNGDHSAQGDLNALDTVWLTAEIGSSVAQSTGYLYLSSNTETPYGQPRFHYYSAPVGSWVPYVATYTLEDGAVFDADTFQGTFRYTLYGIVDFAHAIPEPASIMSLAVVAGLCRMSRRARGA